MGKSNTSGSRKIEEHLTVGELIDRLKEFPVAALIEVHKWTDDLMNTDVEDKQDAILVLDTNHRDMLARINTARS